jgi:glycosyltransferase involved in cell wall biosynthesis
MITSSGGARSGDARPRRFLRPVMNGVRDDLVVTTVAMCIPTIPPRATTLLPRALASVANQTRLPDEWHVALDRDGAGGWETRNRAVAAATTDYVALMDDDDELLPKHIELHVAVAERDGADLVFAYHENVEDGGKFGPGDWAVYDIRSGPFDPTDPREHRRANCALIRTELARSIGWHGPRDRRTGEPRPRAVWSNDDEEFFEAAVEVTNKIVRINLRTWRFYSHGANTAGMPHRWRSAAIG